MFYALELLKSFADLTESLVNSDRMISWLAKAGPHVSLHDRFSDFEMGSIDLGVLFVSTMTDDFSLPMLSCMTALAFFGGSLICEMIPS